MSAELRPISTTVSTSISGYDGHLSAEIDSRSWGYNGGRSQYFDGDKSYVLVYKSDNVVIISTYCSMAGVSLTYSGKSEGYNYIREGLTFMTPIANSSKPIPLGYKILQKEFIGCTGIDVKTGYTIVRAKGWESPADPTKAPPYAYAFIEYQPNTDLYVFSGLKNDPLEISTQIHGVIFGKAIAM